MALQKITKALLCAAIGAVVLGSFALFGLIITDHGPNISTTGQSPMIVMAKRYGTGDQTLRFAVATMWSVESTFSLYRRLSERIAGDMGLKHSLVLRPSYGALRQAMENDEIDVAFICTGPYVYSLPGESIQLLVEPEFVNRERYRSVILVSSGSGIRSIKDLAGESIAFSDSESFSGRLLPYVMLKEQNIDPDVFFENVIFTGSHDRSISSVDRGIVRAAAVHSIVWEAAKREDPVLRERLKEIWSSDTYGPPPVIVSAKASEAFSDSLKNVFLNLHKDKEGRAILSSIGVARFVPAREENYTSAIRLFQRYERLRGEP